MRSETRRKFDRAAQALQTLAEHVEYEEPGSEVMVDEIDQLRSRLREIQASRPSELVEMS